MIEMIKKLFKNETVRYIFFGGCTTLVNLVSYAILRTLLGIDITIANFISIGLAILFAYVVNKLYVFESRTEGIKALLSEAAQFVGMRLSTLFIEVFGVILLSCVWGMNDMIGKLLIQVVVLVLNYVFSKLYVFNDKKKVPDYSEKELSFRRVKKRCCIWGFAIPAVTVAVGFAVNGVFPFGDHGVLIIDSLHQYLPFFTEFHEKLVNSESLLYSFGGGLGFNFWATFAYYLASPMNFLVTLFPKANMMDAMALFIILKIGLCGLTMAYYLVHRNKGKNYYPIVFSAMFALSSFIIGYYFNLMWLDSIAMLPLIMMGIERIVNGKSGKLFCLSLFYGLFCNYYIGFMLCLFSCLYFLVLWISAKKITFKKIAVSCGKFARYALIAGGMAAIVLVPAYLGLGTTESAENAFPETIKLFVQNMSQLTSQFAFVEPINIADDQIGVNAFCGTATLILACLYLLDHKRSKRERAAKLVFIGLLYASFNVNVLNFIWHGFHVQNGLPNRFAFIYIAMLLLMSFDVVMDLKYLSRFRITLACVPGLAFTVYAAITGLGEREFYTYASTIALLCLYGVLLLTLKPLKTGKKQKLSFQTVFITMGLIEMIATGIVGVCMNGTIGRSTYLDEQTAFEVLMERRGDEDFYRSDIDSTRMRNENMFLGADGVVLFSSTMPAATVDLCKSLGIEARTNKNGYNGFTKLVNDIFSLRYIVSKTDSPSLYQMTKVDYEDPLNLYQNDGALSIGFVVNREIRGWDISQSDHLEVQNQFVELATGHYPIYFLNQNIDMEDGETYTIVLPAGKQVYLDVTEAVEEIEVTTPEYSKTYDKYNDHLYDLGCFEEDTVATVTATFKENQGGIIRANAYVCDQDTYDEVHEILAARQMQTTEVRDGRVRGTVQAGSGGTLLLSIPYDRGWKVKVDGQQTETYPVGQALMGIDLESGEHEISMDYTPPGLWSGSLLTFLCIALYLMTGFLEGMNRANAEAATTEEPDEFDWEEIQMEPETRDGTEDVILDEEYVTLDEAVIPGKEYGGLKEDVLPEGNGSLKEPAVPWDEIDS